MVLKLETFDQYRWSLLQVEIGNIFEIFLGCVFDIVFCLTRRIDCWSWIDCLVGGQWLIDWLVVDG